MTVPAWLAVVALPLGLVIGYWVALWSCAHQNQMARDLVRVLRAEGDFRKSLESLRDEVKELKIGTIKSGQSLDALDRGVGLMLRVVQQGGKLTTAPRHDQVGPGMADGSGDGLAVTRRMPPEAGAPRT